MGGGGGSKSESLEYIILPQYTQTNNDAKLSVFKISVS